MLLLYASGFAESQHEPQVPEEETRSFDLCGPVGGAQNREYLEHNVRQSQGESED